MKISINKLHKEDHIGNLNIGTTFLYLDELHVKIYPDLNALELDVFPNCILNLETHILNQLGDSVWIIPVDAQINYEYK